MADTAYDEKRIRDEAAGWYAKLNNTTISTEMLYAFREWRNADERRAAAYADIEAFWQRAAKVEHHPEIQRAIAEAMAREKPASGLLPRIGPRGLVSIAIVLGLSAAGMSAWPLVMGRTYRTDVGEQRFIQLADGSRLRLDTESVVRVKLSGKRRDLELISGRAFFDVAHDATRPFIVKAGDATVRALGTRFAVERSATSADVTLVEGKVRVDSDAGGHAKTWTLSPGQQVQTMQPLPTVHPVDTSAATSWTSGRLTFRGKTLAEAAAEVNRYSDRKVFIEEEAAGRRISGVFDAGDTDAFVAAVSELYELKPDVRGQAIHMRPAA